MMNVLVFDIETIPDVESGRRLYGNATEMDKLDDKDVARVMEHYRSQESDGNSTMLRHHLHKIVAISAVFRHQKEQKFKVWSLGEAHSSEAELLQRFFEGIQKYTPNLVSWNGGGFDIPVINYRALVNGISAPSFWATNGDFKWNNYLNRFHERHLDLMDVLACYQNRAFVPLDQMASILGFPGKLGMSGDKVWETYLNGDIKAIRDYCETDVLNTYLVYLRFELLRGNLDQKAYEQECELVRDTLKTENKPHFSQFLSAWKE